MKIAQVDVNFQFSSTGKLVSDLVVGLKKRNHSTMAYFGRGPDPRQEGVHKISSRTEVLLHGLATRLTGFTGGYSPFATRHLIRLLSEFRPDVVHLHDLHGYFVNIGELVDYLKSSRTATVWTFHSEFMYTGKCGHAFDCDKWKSQCHHCPDLAGYPKSWFFDFTTRMFEQKRKMFDGFERLHLAAPSEWLANRMRGSVIVGGRDVSVIPNGLDVEIFQRRDAVSLKAGLGLSSDEYIVLSVGSNLLSELKGGKWIVELAKRNPDITFVMVGVEQVSSEALKNVKMIRRLYDQKLLSTYYSMANLLLLTSSKETFSMVSAESLACGTPVIGFDSGAPKEVAWPGYGEFVPYPDIESLESLLRKVKDGQQRMKSTRECEAFARSRYSKEVMVDSYENIYSQMMSKNQDMHG